MVLRHVTPGEVPTLQLDPIDAKTIGQAQEILDSVKTEGVGGFLKHAIRLGDLPDKDTKFLYTSAELEESYKTLPDSQRSLLDRTASRIRTFAEAQRNSVNEFKIKVSGGHAGQSLRPVEAAGCYAPGGRYPLPSSVLMTAITAKVAGVKNVVVASPRPTQVTLAAAFISGCDIFLSVGGPQAIAAFAYGLSSGDDSIPQCQVIVGPGNKWVTAAKQLVSGVNCSIDMLAGPSECLVIADSQADPVLIAADLIAQAEHDTDALPILVTDSEDLISKVNSQLEAQLETMPEPNKATALESTSKGLAVLCNSLEESISVAKNLAPEHLEIMVSDENEAKVWGEIDSVDCCGGGYGGLFVGALSAEVFGDYGAGPNHVLPTSGTARYTGGLSIFNFIRIRTWMKLEETEESKQGVRELVNDSADLARLEGLEGHARAAEASKKLLE